MARVLSIISFVLFFSVSSFSVAWAQATYVGSETCLGCHEKDAQWMIKRSAHWKKAIPGAPVNNQGCEACHGPGSIHVEKGGGKGVGGLITFAKGEPAERKAEVCLSCHENQPQLALWESGTHKQKEVACSDCHTLMNPPKAPAGYGTGMDALGYYPGWEYATCGKCHLDIKARVNRRSHHPIVEGKVTCTNCHNPHGAVGPSMIKEPTTNQLCYKCHAEKRGPFMFEHPPVEEDCTICHNPHGSVHLKLTVEKVPNLCQGCHDGTGHPGTRWSRETLFAGARIGGTPSARSFGRSCLNCHANIHGSNAPVNPASLGSSGAHWLR